MSIEDERAIKAVTAQSPRYTTEQALRVQDLAQLGARVLEILRGAPTIREELSDTAALAFQAAVRSDVALLVHGAARSLGLLEEKGKVKL